MRSPIVGPKIRRQAAPDNVQAPDELGTGMLHSLRDPAPGYKARFGRGRWSRLDEFDETEDGERYELRHRVTRACIEREGQVVGAMKLVEYDIPPIWASWLWEAMDGYSSATADLAHVLLRAWPDLGFDVACYGNVLELSRLWVEPGHSATGLWIPVAHDLLRRVEHQTAIVIAKAYPLEYEGKLPEGAPERPAFERRRRAMIRYYGQHLALRPLPGKSGEEGWLWRPRRRLEEVIDEPIFDEGWMRDI